MIFDSGSHVCNDPRDCMHRVIEWKMQAILVPVIKAALIPNQLFVSEKPTARTDNTE